MTHSSDFAQGLVGLLGHRQALGEAFHITSDEVLCWNQIYQQLADAAGVRDPNFVHIASDFLAAVWPDETGGLHGDKSSSVVLDNSKIKRYVPGYCATVRFADGIRESVAWYDADPARRVVDAGRGRQWDVVVEAYARGLEGARAALG
jgi:nucleoside-diphosphate-sugar epimerase